MKALIEYSILFVGSFTVSYMIIRYISTLAGS